MATARKTKATAAKNPTAKRAIDDNFVAPKARKPKVEVVTLAEALEEAGQSIEELLQTPPEDDRPTKPAGTSNLATTIRAYRSQYATVAAPNGRKTQNNGDAIAQALLRIKPEAMAAFIQTKFPGLSYAHLNPGQPRMNMGNRLRTLAKKQDADTLLWLEQAQEHPTEDAEDAEQAAAEAEPVAPKAPRKRKPKAKA